MAPSLSEIATICRIAHDSSLRGAGISLRELLKASDYRRLRPDITEAAVAEYLADHPEVVTQWSMYSDDKRTRGGWYFLDDGNLWAVGRVGPKGARTDERKCRSPSDACAHFVLLELDFLASLSDR
jgi:hypothetical protein